MPPARNASVSITSGGFRRFPASSRRVSAGPVFNEPAQTPPRQALEIVDESSGRILGGEVSALPALSAGHFRFDQRSHFRTAQVVKADPRLSELCSVLLSISQLLFSNTYGRCHSQGSAIAFDYLSRHPERSRQRAA